MTIAYLDLTLVDLLNFIFIEVRVSLIPIISSTVSVLEKRYPMEIRNSESFLIIILDCIPKLRSL